MPDFFKVIQGISNREDFINFLKLLKEDLRVNEDEWENKDLDSYLEAMESWTEDMDGFYEYQKIPFPKDVDWKVFARILIAAKMYE